MKKFNLLLFALTIVLFTVQAQQLPNAGFEDWNGATFDGEIQPTSWNASNVTQFGYKFNFAHREAGHTGNYSMRVSDQDMEVAGINGGTSPGYFTLGTPWVYIEKLTKVNEATAGTYGGISWKYRPDSMTVWIKRTGNNTDKERFYLLYYGWSGSSVASKYKGKNGDCTSVDGSLTDEESDIRQSMDPNTCGTNQTAKQICEGQYTAVATYNDWTRMSVPIYYMNDAVPEKMNIIFSAGRYPEQRANSGLYDGNNLYVDDAELKYSDKIQKLVINGVEWKAFDPNSTEEQVYSLGITATKVPTNIKAIRGAGEMTSTTGKKVIFTGRHLGTDEMTIVDGNLDTGTPTLITVRSEDGQSTRTYKIKFVKEPSHNAKLDSLALDGVKYTGFVSNAANQDILLPYGTTTIPTLTAGAQEQDATVIINAATSLPGTATIVVTAPDGTTTMTYTLNIKVALLADNTLQDIKVNGQGVAGFSPQTTIYKVSLPISTTTMPTVEAVSAYAEGEQTITYIQPSVIDGGQYKIEVSTPGATTPKVYKLNLRLEASSYAYLKDLRMGEAPNDTLIKDFDSQTMTYYVTLPMGTSSLPTISYTMGDAYQTVEVISGGLDGTTRVVVTAGDGTTQATYKIVVSTRKSTRSDLKMIYIGGDSLEGFSSDQLNYDYALSIGTTEVPEIRVDKGDEYETVKIITGGVNGTTRITVSAGDGSSTIYQINFSVQTSSDATLKMIYLDGDSLKGFEPNKLEYTVELPEGTKTVPVVTYEQHDAYQTVIARAPQSLPGKYRLTVKPQTGSSKVYILNLKVKSGEGGEEPEKELSKNCDLSSISLNGTLLEGFDKNTLYFTHTLASGEAEPSITFVAADSTATTSFGATSAGTYSITVVAENGDQKTYTISFSKTPYSNVAPILISVEGYELGYQKEQITYTLSIADGVALPTLTVTPDAGQDIVITNVGENVQTVLVTAENGDSRTYTITYSRILSDNALLRDILVGGKSLKGFASDVHAYTYDTLPQGTKIIPSVHPVGQITNQTIVTEYCRPGGTVKISVTAQNPSVTAEYTIAFPVKISGNNRLQSLDIDGVESNFDPEKMTYDLELGYTDTVVPTYVWETEDEYARVELESKPLGDTSVIRVVAENGEAREYKLYFHRKQHTELNELKSLTIQETGAVLDVKADSQTVALPYGTRTLTVVYEKNYASQTVVVENGGVYRPTTITVKANRKDEADKKYTIVPVLNQTNPATLTGITLDGTAIADFEPERYTYVVNVSQQPLISTTKASGVDVNIVETNQKHWQATVSKDGYTNTYDVWFYYQGDVIPNGEFTDWTNASTYTSATKPTGWNTIADVLGKHSGFGTFTPDGLVKKDGTDIVRLCSPYSTPGGGNIPGFITLGTVSGKWGISGSSSFSVSGGITFRNTPDTFSVSYKNTSYADNPQILLAMTGSGGYQMTEMTDVHDNEWAVLKKDMSEVYSTVGFPSLMNITLNSYYQISGTTTCWKEPTMYVDWVKFTYNSKLSSLRVNGTEATMSGNTFEVALEDTILAGLPTITGTGEVSNQAQKVIWGAESKVGEYGVRTATIWNYAEDGSKTDYTLNVKRPLETRNVLTDLKLDGKTISGFSASQKEYTVALDRVEGRYPDIEVAVESPLTVTTMTWQDSTMVITVTPEYGEATIYRVRFVTPLSHNTELKAMSATGVSYNPEQRVYELAAIEMPVITYTKAYDGQTVVQNGGVLTVTAEDGTVGEYEIRLTTPKTTGQLTELELNDGTMSGYTFNPTTYDYNLVERPDNTSFVREARQDSVVFTQTEKAMTWNVMGSEDSKTYALHFLTAKGTSAALEGIEVDGDSLQGFDPQWTEYTIESDSNVVLRPLTKEGQTVTVSRTGDTYTIGVKSEDGMATMAYTVKIAQPKSDEALLSSIELDQELVEGFEPETMAYRVVLPLQGEYKVAQPKMPDLTYSVMHKGETVEVQPATALGEMTYLYVTAEDGLHKNTYNVQIEAEPSHYTKLSGISVNGTSVPYFEKDRHAYAAQTAEGSSTIGWTSPDKFVTVSIDTLSTPAGGLYTLTVTAEDGVSQDRYTLFISYGQSGADSLSMIYEDGVELEGFQPSTHYYHRTLPVGTTSYPEITWDKADEGQRTSQSITHQEEHQQTVQIKVISASGQSTSYYTIQYEISLSDVDTLKMIYLNGDSLSGYEGQKTEYSVTLKAGTTVLPTIMPIPGDDYQTIVTDTVDDPYVSGKHAKKAVVSVKAQNGSQRTYTIHFPIALSMDATLKNIYYGGVPVEGFEPETYRYTQRLAEGQTTAPVITVEKSEAVQQVAIQFVSDMEVNIEVTAEDGVTKATYTVKFFGYDSDVATLKDIQLDSISIVGFNPTQNDYAIELPYGTMALPEVTWTVGAKGQTVTKEIVPIQDRQGSVTLKVTSANGEEENEYTIAFTVALNSDASIRDIRVKGETMEGFVSGKTEFEIVYADTCTAADFFDMSQMEVIPTDSDATVAVSQSDQEDQRTILITVTAADGTKETTTITQARADASNSLLEMIVMDEYELEGFDPHSMTYNYWLKRGVTTVPDIEAIPQDERSDVSIYYEDMTGDTAKMALITCMAEDGTYSQYTIYFITTSINDSEDPRPEDVIVKVIDGSHILVSTLRRNVSFGLFDPMGHEVAFEKNIISPDPNNAVTEVGANGATVLIDVKHLDGTTTSIRTNQIYVYCFYESGKYKICSGKMYVY